jgi:hypothetical protein
MRSGHRTTARSIILAAVIAGSVAGPAGAAVPDLVFPVVGLTHYTNDFGDPRGSHRHQGNDLMAARRTPVVAVEPGRVRIYRKSASAGCMLYLYGRSGTTYMYIHLNDDLTMKDDNKATNCRVGVAYAPGLRNDQQVKAGELIGFVGNSGDARGIATHLHFELHPNGRRAVSPYKRLRAAPKLLYTVRGGIKTTTLSLKGVLKEVGEDSVVLRVSRVLVSAGPGARWIARRVRVGFAPEMLVDRRMKDGRVAKASLATAKVGETVKLWTSEIAPTMATRLAAPRVIAAAKIRLMGVPES